MYVYTEDACHGHVTLSKVRELYNFTTPQRLHFLPSRKTLCTVAESSEVQKPNEERINQAVFLNRLIGGLPFSLVVFTCKWCKPSLIKCFDKGDDLKYSTYSINPNKLNLSMPQTVDKVHRPEFYLQKVCRCFYST